MFVSHAANYPALWWEWGGEEEGEEGLGGSAKAILKLLLTHASPHQGVAARGGCHHVRRNGLAQLVGWEGPSVRPTAPGSLTGAPLP